MQEIVDGSKGDQDRNSPYNIKQTSDDVQYKIFRSSLVRIDWEAVRRITD